ncbi:unnamed protein product [Arctia plantaginis]|uniref:C2H2-type domain-containing protein n=1 Tax=Arctia plantaginis TaxID=874455 RepID=A0A8S0ZVY8_ARCPL|nr:unnamed protein product [Arctia plantaginis]
MACKASFELHHHFPKLAEEAGFTFNTHRPRIHIDWNKIRLIDIDSLVKERKFYVIEQHLNDILDCVFESEFDVRILDEGVMKIFRLAQLAVEYQQFCRHYLDRSVYVLRDEVTSLAQELNACKKDLREKDDELRRLRKRIRHPMKTTLPYGNDNIATMILKTLSQKGDIFPLPTNDIMQYNKCHYCDKVFLNQLYLKSHISRRHGNVIESPQKDIHQNSLNNENTKLSAEVTELKNKIKEMEIVIANTTNQVNNHLSVAETKIATISVSESVNKNNNINEIKKEMKDAEVSTSNEEYLINKIEEWKKEEYANYNKEMNKLRSQIMETISTIKDNDSDEILALTKQLNDSRMRAEKENTNRNKEYEAQVSFWSNRAEDQSKQYELLLQKLNDVANDAKESRNLAETEKERAEQLKALLQQSLDSKRHEHVESNDDVVPLEKITHNSNVRIKALKLSKNIKGNQLEKERDSLEKLHQKAQELLNIASVTSSSSDTSSIDHLKPIQRKDLSPEDITTRFGKASKVLNSDIVNKSKISENKPQKPPNTFPNKASNSVIKNGPKYKGKSKTKQSMKSLKRNGPNVLPGSPVKIVRAKITEEVNNRLVSAGVDIQKSRLPQNIFQKQRMQLHQLQELKSKKNPNHDKVRHQILTFLDSSTMGFKKEATQVPDYISPTKVTKSLKNLSSVISNVKSKALSFVKLSDSQVKDKHKSQNAEVAKRALSLLKTPPGSASSSPVTTKRSPIKAYNISQNLPRDTNETVKINHKSKNMSMEEKKTPSPFNALQTSISSSGSEELSEGTDRKNYNTTSVQQSSKSIETLIKSPARRPSSAGVEYNQTVQKFTISNENLLRTQSATNLLPHINNLNNLPKAPPKPVVKPKENDNSSDDVESFSDVLEKNAFLNDNVENTAKQTKSVLKNASSTSSLNKKKVFFDMDAIQMKSVSASPSQSLTEKSDGNEKYELGIVNLDGEEWDISSIENEPLKNDTKIQNVTRTSPKIAELKKKIESQLARRNETQTAPVGRVDVLTGNLIKIASTGGGSNTSLGSSILDDSESIIGNHKTVVKPRRVTTKDDSDVEISEFSIDHIINKNESF